MTLAEMIYHHSLNLPEPVAQEALEFIQKLEKRYGLATPDDAPQDLTPEQKEAYLRLSQLQIDWQGKPIIDRDEANAH